MKCFKPEKETKLLVKVLADYERIMLIVRNVRKIFPNSMLHQVDSEFTSMLSSVD